MTDSLVDTLAEHLGRKLGRKVVVHRTQDQFKKPGFQGRMVLTKGAIKYSIGIGGCNPPVFFGMTVGEAKARLAMLNDMLTSGVIHATAQNLDRNDALAPDPGATLPAGPDVEHLDANHDDTY